MIKQSASKKRIQKISLIFFRVLLWLIFIVFCFYVGLSIFKPNLVVKVFKFQPYVIQTGSMDPVLKIGDLVLVTEVEVDNLKENEIITFYADINFDGKREIVTHYFANRETDAEGNIIYRTKSERGTDLDRWKLDEEDIIGKYLTHIPSIGKFVLFFHSNIGLRVLVADIIIVFLILLLINNEDKQEKKQEKII